MLQYVDDLQQKWDIAAEEMVSGVMVGQDAQATAQNAQETAQNAQEAKQDAQEAEQDAQEAEQDAQETAQDAQVQQEQTVPVEETGNDIQLSRRDTEYLNAVEEGDTAEAQRMVDEAAEQAFSKSKIRGADGKLLKVYHGTNAEFTVFDTSKQGGVNGTAEGYGIYLSDNQDVTKNYGERQIEAYANITNPATSWKKTITQAKLAKLIKASCTQEAQRMVDDGEHDNVRDAMRDTWISNYTDTYSVSMETAIRDTARSILDMNGDDMSIVQEVMVGMAIRSYRDAERFYREILTPTTGIDGFWTKWENREGGADSNIILAMNSNQIKDASPVTYDDAGKVIPLSERFDTGKQDIRFSLREVDGQQVVWVDENILASKPESISAHKFIRNYLVDHIDDVYTVIESGSKVHPAKQLPQEYLYSREAQSHNKSNRNLFSAKLKIVPGIGEMVEIASNRRWEKTKHIHNKNAKYGVYRYDTRVAFESNGVAEAYTAELVILNADDGKKYLYDIVNIKKDDITAKRLMVKARSGGETAQQTNAVTDSILQSTESVNPDRKFSRRDEMSTLDVRQMMSAMQITDGMTETEKDMLTRYKSHLTEMQKLEEQIAEQKAIIDSNDATTDEKAAAKARMKIYDRQRARHNGYLRKAESRALPQNLCKRPVWCKMEN